MNNKSNKASFYLIDSIVYVVIVLISFLLTSSFHTKLYWFSQGFMLFAFILQITAVTVYYADHTGKGEYYVFNLPFLYSSVCYLIIQGIAGLLFSIFSTVNFKIAVVIQLLIFLVYIIPVLISLMGARHLNERSEIKSAQPISFIKRAAAQLGTIEALAENRDIKSDVHKIYEQFKMSNPLTNDSLIDVESKIDEQLAALKEQINNSAEAEKILKHLKELVTERNNLCKIIKG